MSKFKEYLKTMDKRKKYIGISAIGLVACVAIGIGTYSFFSSKPVSNNKEPERELIVQEQSEKVNKYTGDKKDFHFNKYWSDRSGGIYTINESNDVTNVEYKKNMGSEWAYMAAPVEGNFSDFKYINLKVSGDKGKKLFLKLEENLVELKAKFFTLNGKEQILTLDISDVKNKKKLDGLKEVMLFASPGEVQDGSFKIIDAWFSMESATVNKYTGDKKDFHFNKYWEDIFNHGITIEEENETTTMTFTKPKDNNWILASTAVEGKLSDFNYATLKVKGEVGQKFLLKLEKGDSVYGEKLVELSGEEEVVIVKLNKDDMEGLDSLKEVRVFPNAGEPENGKLDILDAWFSVEKPEGFKEAGEATPSGANSEYINGWKIEEWTKYVGENIGGLTKVTYNNPEPWAYVTYNVEGKVSGNNLLNIYLNSNGCDHVMIKLRGKFKYVDPVGGYNVYDEVEVFSDKIKQGETNLQVDITDAVKELGHVVEVVMFVESSQNVKDVDRVGSLIFGAPKFTEGQAIGNSTSSNKWLVEDWTGYTAEIKDGFTRISYDNPAPWANISYNIKNLLKDNDFLELKLNSNGADHIQVKLRGKYLNSDPGYKVYQEALVFDGKLNNGEKTLKLDLKEAINELGRENITDIMLFIESNQLVNGLDRKGSLDIYTPVFKKATQTTPETPGTPEEPGVGTNNEWVVDEWTGYTAEVKDGFTRISYDNPAEWAYINLNIKNLLKDNDVLSLKLNSNGADHVQIKLRGKYLNSDPGYKVYDDILIFDGKLKNGEQTLNLKLKDFIKELGRENITDIIMFVESSQAVDGLDRKGSLDIYTPVFNKDTETTPETPENPNPDDKNIVINSTFDSSLGNWEVFKQVDSGDATGEIKDGAVAIDVNKIGSENWHVQFVNKKLKLEKGATYKYSVKLKSTVNRPVEIVIQEDGGSYKGFSSKTEKVTNEYQVFTNEFKYDGESSTNLAFLINLGKVTGITNLDKHTVYVDEIKLVKVSGGSVEETPEQPEEPQIPETPEANNVINSTFDSSLGDWEVFKEKDSGDAAGIIKDGAAVIDVNKIGSENWHVQFVNKKLKLEKGATYKYYVKLKSTVNRPVEIVIQEDGGSYKGFSSKTENLNNQYQVFTNEFKYDGESSTNLAFLINLGKVTGITNLDKHTVYVDQIKLVKVSGGTVEETPEQPEEPQIPETDNAIINSTFDVDGDSWYKYSEKDENASLIVKDGVAQINVKDIGSLNWHVQLKNESLKLEKGATYKYYVKLKSSVDRPIEIVLQENGGSYDVFTSKIENATDKYQVFENEFEYKGEDETSLVFLINLGKVEGITDLGEHTVFIDGIKLVKVSDGVVEEEPVEPQIPETDNAIINSTFDINGDSWYKYSEKDENASLIVEDGVAKINVKDIGSLNWHVQLKNESLKLEKGATYKYYVKLRSSVDRPIEIVLQENGGGYTVFTSKIENATDKYQVFEKEFEYKGEDETSLVFLINLGKVEGITDLGEHTVSIDGIKLVKVNN